MSVFVLEGKGFGDNEDEFVFCGVFSNASKAVKEVRSIYTEGCDIDVNDEGEMVATVEGFDVMRITVQEVK